MSAAAQNAARLTSSNKELQELLAQNKQITKELTEANERLRELDSVKSEFVSVAAHQLRTPLTGIKWTLHALATNNMGELAPDQKKAVDDVLQAVVSLILVVNDLLDVARIEEQKFGFTLKKQSLTPIIQIAAENWTKEADKKNIDFSLRLPAEDLPLTAFDEGKISVLLDNLLSNAVKYTRAGGKIRLEAEVQNKNVVVTITDTGIGIPESKFNRIFTKFFRSHEAQQEATSGSGLGLYMTKEIIDLHDGRIGFDSTEGKGSSFWFSLPIRA